MNQLAQPLKLKNVTLSNRLAKAALSENLASPDGAPSEALMRLYERWAGSGAGLSITGNVMVDGTARAEPGNVVVEDDRHLAALRHWAGVVQAGGSAGFVQINHPGRQIPRHVGSNPVAPSALAVRGMGGLFARPRVLQDSEIRAIITRFGRTAQLVREAGFAGVQIHAAHGYLISQFLSPLSNLREDAWGGDPERRARFLSEVVRSVRAAVGPDYPVAVKLNSADFQRGGFSEEDSMRVVDMLEAEGVDLLEISGGTYESAAMVQESGARASTRAREAFFLDYAEKVRARTKLPIMLTGGFRSVGAMQEALASGSVDLVGVARPLIVDPELCARLLRGEVSAAPSVSLATGIRQFDAFMQNAWYQAQIRRLAAGLLPNPALSRGCATLRYLVPMRVDRAVVDTRLLPRAA
jgi:2,4-dienoyl-CoA reductase-like NADH-dependent reductase (Old Yellow Enzyme family)